MIVIKLEFHRRQSQCLRLPATHTRLYYAEAKQHKPNATRNQTITKGELLVAVLVLVERQISPELPKPECGAAFRPQLRKNKAPATSFYRSCSRTPQSASRQNRDADWGLIKRLDAQLQIMAILNCIAFQVE